MENRSYVKEKQYALYRLLFILFITFASFLFVSMTDKNLDINLFLLKVLLVSLSIISLLHYAIVLKFPETLVEVRKFTILVLDLIVLTVSIKLTGSMGLFLLPLYILIVMESGVTFGYRYFYFSLAVASVSWIWLIQYSDYWANHIDSVAIFAVTTYLIPLFYLNQITNMHQEHEILHETLESTNHEANFDVLTGLANRKQYESYMSKLLEQKGFFALLFIDLNKFKAINDTHGHDAGDEVLIEVAKRLTQSIDNEDMLARLGGDEFVIITRRKKVFLTKFIEKLEHITIGDHQIGDISVRIELSIGISLFPDDSKSEAFLRKCADEAMYVAKKEPEKYHIFYNEITEVH